jgi:hypothetical protein
VASTGQGDYWYPVAPHHPTLPGPSVAYLPSE